MGARRGGAHSHKSQVRPAPAPYQFASTGCNLSGARANERAPETLCAIRRPSAKICVTRPPGLWLLPVVSAIGREGAPSNWSGELAQRAATEMANKQTMCWRLRTMSTLRAVPIMGHLNMAPVFGRRSGSKPLAQTRARASQWRERIAGQREGGRRGGAGRKALARSRLVGANFSGSKLKNFYSTPTTTRETNNANRLVSRRTNGRTDERMPERSRGKQRAGGRVWQMKTCAHLMARNNRKSFPLPIPRGAVGRLRAVRMRSSSSSGERRSACKPSPSLLVSFAGATVSCVKPQ